MKLLLAAPAYVGLTINAFLAKPEWVAILAIRFLVLASFGLSVGVLIVGGRCGRSFAGGAILPLATGALWALKPVFDNPVKLGSGQLTFSRWASLLLKDGRLEDFEYRAAFILLAALLCGLMGAVVGVVISSTAWLT